MDFINYCLEFYGPSGLYPLGVTKEQIEGVLQELLDRPDYDFAGDSFDRENIRDILMERFKLEWGCWHK